MENEFETEPDGAADMETSDKGKSEGILQEFKMEYIADKSAKIE